MSNRTVQSKRDLVFTELASNVEVMGLSSKIKLTRKAIVLLLDLRNPKSMMRREGKKYARSSKRFRRLRKILT